MHKTAMPALSGFLTVVLASSAALAGEPADLQRQIDDLKAKVENLQAKKDAPSSSASEKKSSWTDKISLFGDFRYRHEDIDQPGRETAVGDRNRDRIRARLGLKAKVNDEVDMTVRIATSEASSKVTGISGTTGTSAATNGADPASTNQTMGNFFTKKAIFLDQAYFDYHPDALKDAGVPLDLLGGKMPVPFITPGGSDLIWDGDLTPEGGALKVSPKIGEMAELTGVLGGFWVQERQTSGSPPDNGEDAGIFGAQLALKLNFEEKGRVYATAGVGYFNYVNTQGKAVFDFTNGTSSFGNVKNSDNTYRSDFDEAELFAEVGFPVMDVPVTLYADFVDNTGVKEDTDGDKENTGYMLGLNVGKLKERWDWSFGYNYRLLEKDAVVGAFTDSDSGGGGTNIKGSKFGAQLMVLKNVTLAATYFMDKVNIDDDTVTDKNADYNRLQLDVMFRF